MQTTLRMDEDILRSAKAAAAEDGISLTAFIEAAIRRSLETRRRAKSTERPAIPTFRGGGGLQPGVNLDSNSELLDLMENL